MSGTRDYILLALRVSAVATVLVGAAMAWRAYQDHQSRLIVERYRQTASKAQGRLDAEMSWPKGEADCPRWNPNYTAGCLEVVRARAAEEQMRLAKLRADKPRQDQLIIQGIINRMESGHDAGYDWAQKNSINSESDCSNDSGPFEEGCRRYVADQEHGDN